MAIQTQPTETQAVTAGCWPSRYGAEDHAAALDEATLGKVLEAVRLARLGRVYDLAHVLHLDIPALRRTKDDLDPHHRAGPGRLDGRQRATASPGLTSHA
jgi:hypothetical protein